jgi:hypothetical protein
MTFDPSRPPDQVTGGFRPGDGSANGSGGVRFGTAADVTVLP